MHARRDTGGTNSAVVRLCVAANADHRRNRARCEAHQDAVAHVPGAGGQLLWGIYRSLGTPCSAPHPLTSQSGRNLRSALGHEPGEVLKLSEYL